jgi:ribose transport system substrate-binding protein
MKKSIISLVLVLLLALSMAAFAGGGKEEAPTEEEAAKEEGAITVGFSLWTMEYTFFQNVEKGVKDACAELGYEYIMIDQNADPTKMVQDINTLVGQSVDGIVITPVDPGAIGPAVQNARDAGIPVVCADIGKTGPVNALLISNNYEGGQMAMDYIDEKVKEMGLSTKKVAVGRVKPQWTYARNRGKGFIDRAEELGYEVAAELVVENPSAEGGYDTMQQIFSKAPDVVGVFFASGREAVGAANAIKASGKDTLVVGYNGDPEELQAIEDGVLDATVAQQPYFIGYESVMVVQEILEEGAEYEDAEIPVEVELLTPDNYKAWAEEAEARRGQPAY